MSLGTYKYEDIFQEDPNNSDNVIMTFPPALIEHLDLKVGDPLKISVGDLGTLIIEKIEDVEE